MVSRRDPRHRFVVAGLLVEPFLHLIKAVAETSIGHDYPDPHRKPALSVARGLSRRSHRAGADCNSADRR
jgi:hypothetical protein